MLCQVVVVVVVVVLVVVGAFVVVATGTVACVASRSHKEIKQWMLGREKAKLHEARQMEGTLVVTGSDSFGVVVDAFRVVVLVTGSAPTALLLLKRPL